MKAESNMQKFIIILWEGIPDDNYVAVIPSEKIDEKVRSVLDALDGWTINGDFDLNKKENQDIVEFVFDAFINTEEKHCSVNNMKYRFMFQKYMLAHPRGTKLDFGDILVEKIYRIGQYL